MNIPSRKLRSVYTPTTSDTATLPDQSVEFVAGFLDQEF